MDFKYYVFDIPFVRGGDGAIVVALSEGDAIRFMIQYCEKKGFRKEVVMGKIKESVREIKPWIGYLGCGYDKDSQKTRLERYTEEEWKQMLLEDEMSGKPL